MVRWKTSISNTFPSEEMSAISPKMSFFLFLEETTNALYLTSARCVRSLGKGLEIVLRIWATDGYI